MDDPLVARVIDIVSGIAGPEQTPPDAGPDTRLWNGGFWLDSIALFEVMLACDQAFGRSEDPSLGLDALSLESVGSLAAAIRARLDALRAEPDQA